MKLDEKELDLLITSYTAKRRLARRYVYIEVSVTELATVLSLGGRGLVQYDKEGNVLHVRATRNAVVLLRKHYRRELIDYWVSHQLPIGIITDVMRNLTFKVPSRIQTTT
jgi:hypothetical protein